MQLLKNKPLSVALFLELLLIIAGIVMIVLPKETIYLDSSSIPFNNGYYDGGCYINEETGYSGFFTYGPNINLSGGIYRISVDYVTDTDSNYVSLTGDRTRLRAITYDYVNLPANKTSVSFDAWLNTSIRNFQIVTNYCGSGSLKITGMSIRKKASSYLKFILTVIVVGAITDLFILLAQAYRKKSYTNEAVFVGLALLAAFIFSSMPLFTDFLNEGHDITFHLLRIEGIKDGLMSGQFPVKLQPTQLSGYGYAVSVFYGDLFLYIPAILRICGFTVMEAYKAFCLVVNAATLLIGYYSFGKIFNNKKIAVTGSILYALSPYRLVNIYSRAAVGEYTAMIFIPLLACGLYLIFTSDLKDKNYKKTFLIPTIAYTGIIESHILSCEMVAIFTILICLIMIKKVFVKTRFIELCKIVIATALINLGFLVPFLDYMLEKNCSISNVSMNTTDIQQNGVYAARLFTTFLNADGIPYSRTAFADYGMRGEMGVSIGIALLACCVLFIYFALITNKKKTAHYELGKLALLLGIFTLILSTDIFPWDLSERVFGSLASNFQFPWRFLGIGSMALAVCGCAGLEMIQENYEHHNLNLAVTAIMVILIFTSGYLMDSLLYKEDPYRVYSELALPVNTTGTSYDEYAPFGTDISSLPDNYTYSSDDLKITDYTKNYNKVTLKANNTSSKEEYVMVPLLYYKGYKATYANTIKPCIDGTNHIVTAAIPAGYNGSVKITFHKPMLWIAGELISLISIIGIAYIYFFRKTPINKNKKK